jgi:hypothetical protein
MVSAQGYLHLQVDRVKGPQWWAVHHSPQDLYIYIYILFMEAICMFTGTCQIWVHSSGVMEEVRI